MKNLEPETRVIVSEKNGKKTKTWFGIIKKVHDNVNPPEKHMNDCFGYSIMPEGAEFQTLKIRHHTFVKKA